MDESQWRGGAAAAAHAAMNLRSATLWFLFVFFVACAPAIAQDNAAASTTSKNPDNLTDEEIIRLVDNPIADVYTIPFENNFGMGAGENRVFTDTFNFKPIIPFYLNANWDLITRTIAPVIYRVAQKPGASDAFGMGDVETTFYVSPAQVPKGFNWGIGPVVHMPTETAGLARNQWGVGPAGAVVWQRNGWTLSMLANQTWSFGNKQDLNNTNLDPAIGEFWDDGFGWKLEANSNYNWISRTWSIPLKGGFSQLVHVDGLPVSLGLAALYYASRSSTDPQWSIRLTVQFVFPK